MSQLHDNELAYLVDSLTSHQRVVLQRLLGEFLTSLPPADGEPHPDCLPLLRHSAASLIRLVGLLRNYHNDDDDCDIRPFSMTIPEPGHAMLLLNRRILHWQGLWDSRSHDWAVELRLGRMTVDLRLMEEMTSSAISWLTTLAQHLPNCRLHLINVPPTVQRTIQVLGLDLILVVEHTLPITAADQRRKPTEA